MNLKRAGRGLLWALGLIALAVLALAAAWLASNNRWVDAAPQPRPAALQPRQVSSAPEANVFFDLAGLLAPANESPLARGQAVWAGAEAGAVAAPRLAKPKDPRWDCKWAREDCLVSWSQDALALKVSLDEQALLLGRCSAIADALSGGRGVFEEPLPQARAELRKVSDQYLALPQASHVQGAMLCLRAFQLQAALAQLDGDASVLAQALARGQALNQAQLSGAQSLLAQTVAWSQARQQLQFAAALLVREPGLAGLVAPQLGPLPARAVDAASWMPAEAFLQAQVFRELDHMCGRVEPLDGNSSLAEPPTLQSEASAWERLKCHFGFMPERSLQDNDAWWLQMQEQAAKLGPEGLLKQMQSQAQEQAQGSGFALLSLPWRNTIGEILFQVARPAHASYPGKQADLLLSHRAAQLVLALAQQPVALTERSAWLARQPMSDGQRERLKLSADVRALQVTFWSREGADAPGESTQSWALPTP